MFAGNTGSVLYETTRRTSWKDAMPDSGRAGWRRGHNQHLNSVDSIAHAHASKQSGRSAPLTSLRMPGLNAHICPRTAHSSSNRSRGPLIERTGASTNEHALLAPSLAAGCVMLLLSAQMDALHGTARLATLKVHRATISPQDKGSS